MNANNITKMFKEMSNHIEQNSINPEDVEKIIISLDDSLKKAIKQCTHEEANKIINALTDMKNKLQQQQEKIAANINATPNKISAIRAYSKKNI